jgi:hypothetical protein
MRDLRTRAELQGRVPGNFTSMPRLPGSKLTPWGRILWMLQIVFASFQELERHERQQAREIAQRIYRDRRVSPNDRQHLVKLAKKAGRGGLRGARGGGTIPRFGRR